MGYSVKSLLLIGFLSLSACSSGIGQKFWFKGDDNSYQNAASIAPLRMPEGLIIADKNIAYPIPPVIPTVEKGQQLSLLPPGKHVVALQKPSVSPAKHDLTKPLVIRKPYIDAWEQVEKALPKANYIILQQDSDTGIFSIADKALAAGNASVYKVCLEQSSDNNTMVTVLDDRSLPAGDSIRERIFRAVQGSHKA